jgi:hypothetical protein
LAGLIRELGDWALELARQCYKPVADSEKIFSSASEALSLPIFYFSLQEAWIREPSADDSYKLTAFFLPYMRRRGMNFVTARRITEDMYDYWTERAKGKNIPADRFFLLNKDTFDRHIAVHRELFALDLPEAFKRRVRLRFSVFFAAYPAGAVRGGIEEYPRVKSKSVQFV